MGVGLELESVQCLEETTSGRNSRVRARRRRRGSDEVAVFVAVHDAFSGDLLTTYRWTATGVDSRELHVVRQIVLDPRDSTDSVLVTVLGYEIDGRGSTETLAKESFEGFRAAVGAGDWGMPVPRRGAYTAARVLLLPPFARRVLQDDTIMLDRFTVDAADVPGRAVPEPVTYTPSDAVPGLSVEGRWDRFGGLRAIRTYRARAEHSEYVLRFRFRV